MASAGGYTGGIVFVFCAEMILHVPACWTDTICMMPWRVMAGLPSGSRSPAAVRALGRSTSGGATPAF